MHYVIKYNRKTGIVKELKEFSDWIEAFKVHQTTIDNEANPDISVSLVDAPNKDYLMKHYGAFFHNKYM